MLKKTLALPERAFDEQRGIADIAQLEVLIQQKAYALLFSTLDTPAYEKHRFSFTGAKVSFDLLQSLQNDELSLIKVDREFWLYPVSRSQLAFSIARHELATPVIKVVFAPHSNQVSFYRQPSFSADYFPFTYAFGNTVPEQAIKTEQEMAWLVEDMLLNELQKVVAHEYRSEYKAIAELAEAEALAQQKVRTTRDIPEVMLRWSLSLLTYPIRIGLEIGLTPAFVQRNKNWFKLIIPRNP